MIKEKTMFTVICDRCGKDALEESEFSCWNDNNAAIDDAVDNHDYLHEGDKHYCPDCYGYDEDGEVILKP